MQKNSARKGVGIRAQFLILMIISFIIIILIVVASYFYVSMTIRNRNYGEVVAYAQQVRDSLEEKCNMYNRFLAFLAFDGTIQEFLTLGENERSRWIELADEINALFENTRTFQDDIWDIILMDNDGNTYGRTRNFRTEEETVLDLLRQHQNYYYSSVLELPVFDYGRDMGSFIVSTDVYSINPRVSSRIIGAVALVLRADGFGLEQFAGTQETIAQMYLLDRAGNVFSSSNASQEITEEQIRDLCRDGRERFEADLGDGRCLVMVQPMELSGGDLVTIVEERDLLSTVIEARNIAVICIWVAVLLCGIPFFFLLRSIVKPMNELAGFMAGIRQGEPDSVYRRISVRGCREAVVMADRCNGMLDEIGELTHSLICKDKRIYAAELEKKQAELSFLQSQINPHFLYNTFDSIKGLAALHNVPEIRDMASNLAQIFRYGVRADSQVPLAEEIGIVRRYLEIQRIRFPDRFEVDICVQKEAETIFVPKMILQPIVENAVQHGLELAESRGVLRIEAFVEPGKETRKLRILVSDNGVGIPPDVLEELREKLAGASSSDAEETGYHTGIGVINVHNRLRLMYGQDCGVTVDSREGRGTLVTITLCADTGKGRAQ